MCIVTKGLLHSIVTKLAYLANYTNYTINISSLLCLDKYQMNGHQTSSKIKPFALDSLSI